MSTAVVSCCAQQLLVENASLKAEVRRLRMDNTDLVRKTGHARANDAYMRVSTYTGEVE